MKETIEILFNKLSLLLNNIKNGITSPSAYDTAWVSLIPSNTDKTKPMYPNCLNWIKKHQLSNGSWGTKEVNYYHERIISTLVCICAIKKWEPNSNQINKGLNFINSNLENIINESYAPVGFEVVLPRLLQMTKEYDLKINYNHPVIIKIEEEMSKKLKLISLDYIYNSPTTLLHSIEALENLIDVKKILKFQSDNGSFLNSPSATAYVYMKTGNKKCLKYIDSLYKEFGDYVPVNYPLDIFTRLWVLDILRMSKLDTKVKVQYDKLIYYVKDYWKDHCGISWSKYVDICDLDDTSVAFKVLGIKSIETFCDTFQNFFVLDNITCFRGELHGSASHMANFLKALENVENNDLINFIKKICIDYLFKKMSDDYHWDDKWHYSPIYVTSSALTALRKHYPEISKNALNWLIKNQLEDGSWRSAEETAYAVLTINYNKDLIKRSVFNTVMKQAKLFLNNPKNLKIYPLWIDKTLYTVEDIVKTAIFSAKIILEDLQ